MSLYCEHGNEFPWVPAGVSKKTGEPYDAFRGSAKPCGCKAPKGNTRRALPQSDAIDALQRHAADILATEPVPQRMGYAPPQTLKDAPRTQTKPEVDWEAKERLTTAQAAMKDAAALYQGTGLEGETAMFQCAAMMYKIMMGCKIGGEVDQLIESIAHVKPREPEAF